MEKSSPSKKHEKLACAGAGGSLGLAALAGACSAGCGFVAAPLAGVLTSAGLGAVASILPTFRIPLFIAALILGLYSIRIFAKQRNAIGAAFCALILGAGSMFFVWQFFAANKCETANTVASVLSRLSPQAKVVFQKGVYPLWPELGRAPTIAEVQKRLGYRSEDLVVSAFREMENMGFKNIFYPGTKDIKWLWPFSSLDHGVEVTLDNLRPVHARCAIDALGMSEMFGKIARVTIRSPLDGRSIEMEINGNKIVKASPDMVVSYSESCDDMLFFASRDEFDRYVQQTGKTYLQLMTLEKALERGIQSFGKILKS